MDWKLLTKQELKDINVSVLSIVWNEEALSEATEGPGFDYAEKLSQAVYCLAVAIAQHHPFVDGNKRTATEAVRQFLTRNGQQPTSEQMEKVGGLINLLADDPPIGQNGFIGQLEHLLGLEDPA